jgi:hypothetical protein
MRIAHFIDDDFNFHRDLRAELDSLAAEINQKYARDSVVFWVGE